MRIRKSVIRLRRLPKGDYCFKKIVSGMCDDILFDSIFFHLILS